MIIIKQFENKNILVVDTVSLKAKLWIKHLWYFANEAWLPWAATNWDYAIVWSTDTVWVWDSDTNAWKNTNTASTWDMMKSVYDTDNDWKVDAAETADSVEWSWVQNKPTTFTPSTHNHNDLYYTESEIDTALWLKQNTLTAWTGITIDNTNPLNPVINSSWWVANFINLSDTPVSYVWQANKILRVNTTENWVEFISLPWWWDMLKSENLSWLSNYATARSNLWLDTTTNQTDSTDKRFMSDAQESKLDWIDMSLKLDKALTNISWIDLNTITDNGFYCANATCTNLPESWIKTRLRVNKDPSNSNLSMQEALTTTTLVSYVRTTANGWTSWTSWTRIKATDETKEPLKWADDNYVTDAQLVVIGNTSNTNSWDETKASIESKLTWTITSHNHSWVYQPLATVLTNTTASYTTTIDTRLANTSWTNTWDNATNTQYSWLATSKQNTLIAWTNITIDKTDPLNPVINSTASWWATDFTDLWDVPSSYTWQTLKVVRVNAWETALEFATISGGWDMMKSVYDTDNDWKVNTAETADSVEWTWVQNKPTAFNPISHSHDDRYYTEVAMDILLATKQNTLVSWTNIKTVNWVTILWSWNIEVWYLNIPQNSQSANYTLVLWDSGKHIYHPSADTTARTITIPANSSVAFPIWTAITFVNDTSAWNLTIAITTDTLVLAWAWTTWNRTLSANWVATAIKITSTRWQINGTWLS